MTKASAAKFKILAEDEPEATAPAASPAQAPAVHAAEVRRMRETIERHFKAHRALSSLLRRLVDPKGEV